ncbi:AI-2E family transporter [Thermomonospora cellulosilytica]|uniref:Putative PurR-regulated permease PerM n=1 Tax=Thermomonospora cellulosilytica TaxID=1411118 RepID=A0A7W3R6L6_9ACTN|nr:AI-2E family transporter [Thermomonospora cellulosilytica]MBA9001666.1 putative PurR-regulated permease PerM [Thermomonospora cellulosilytica]
MPFRRRTKTAPPQPPPERPPSTGLSGEAARVRRDGMGVPAGLRVAAVTGAYLLIIALAVYLVVNVLVRLAPLTLAIVAALLMTALVQPVSNGLRRLRAPAWAAALGGLLALLGAIALPLTLIANRVVGQWDSLSRQTEQGLHRVREWLVTGPLPVSERQLDAAVDGLVTALRNAAPDPVGGATAAAQVLTSIVLALVLLFFLLKDGEQMARWTLGLVPDRHRPRVSAAAAAGWRTLVAYIRGTFLVAAVDAVGIGTGLAIIGVPLALPLALLTFVAAFIPIVGATLAGAIAVLVALVSNGITDALLALGVVLAVQQAEGNLLQPLIMGRALRLHPAVILVVVTAGTLLAGVAGAVVAVPIAAITYRVTLSLRETGRTPPPEPVPEGSA